MNNLIANLNSGDYDRFPGGFFVYRATEDEEILYANKYMVELFECDSYEDFLDFVGGSFKGLVYKEDYDSVEGDIITQVGIKKEKFDHVSYRVMTKNNRMLYLDDYGHLVIDKEEGPLFYVFVANINGKYLEYSIDRLTGLLGMRHFLELVEEKRQFDLKNKGESKGYYLFFDISNFKLYNVTYGLDSGDRCLISVSNYLNEIFPDDYISRFSDDHYVVYTQKEDLLDRVADLHKRVMLLDDNYQLFLRVGIYKAEGNESVETSKACDYAKIACDSLKNNTFSVYCFYTEELKRKAKLKKYIADNIDKAIFKGYIHVYYQPVIRSFSDKLCGMEALTRWEDPNFGQLSPSEFIPALEDNCLTYKLDSYVVREVCKKIRFQLDNKLPIVPISFNFSRLDFKVCNPFEIVENECDALDIPRNLIRVEITESVVMDDAKHFHEEIKFFHDAGYQVWMDDFGSGYSSLNVLKDFYFDEIKIDMAFIHDLSDRSKSIIRSAVDMAKQIGIQTLAEGVETKEQLDFLKKIGCEKIQGFYYGKPMHFDDLIMHCRNRGIDFEDMTMESYYDAIGKVNFITDKPLALFVLDQDQLSILYANDEYMNVLGTVNALELDLVNKNLNSPMYVPGQKFKKFIRKLKETNETDSMSFIDNGCYLKLIGRHVVSNGDKTIVAAELYNITFDEGQRRSNRLDSIMRYVSSIYHRIYYVDLIKGTREVIESNRIGEKNGDIITNIHDFYENYANNYIHANDRPRCVNFFNKDNLLRRIKNGKKGYISDNFRVVQDDGSYKWIEFTVLVVPRTEDSKLIVCVKESFIEDKEADDNFKLAFNSFINNTDLEFAKSDLNKILYNELFNSLISNSSIKFFWKDKNRRFLGASKAFLDFYNIADMADIVGKTDEDMGWHIDDNHFRDDEIDVLERGEIVENSYGQCLADGQVRNIRTYKYPIHKNDEIAGLIGYFYTENEDENLKLSDVNYFKDVSFDVFNSFGISNTIFMYDDLYRLKGEDYSIIIIDLPEYNKLKNIHGHEVAEGLIKKLADILKNNNKMNSAIGRYRDCNFLVITKNTDLNYLRDKMFACQKEVHEIKEILGRPCELYLDYSFIKASDVNGVDEIFKKITGRLSEVERQKLGQATFDAERITFDLEKFDKIDEACFIIDPDSYSLVYMNEKALSEFGYEARLNYKNHQCYNMFYGLNKPCKNCFKNKVINNAYITEIKHTDKNSRDYLIRISNIPWRGKKYFFNLATNIDDLQINVKHESYLLKNQQIINDSMNLVLNEQNVNRGLKSLLEKIAKDLNADRAYIFEENDLKVFTKKYEWVKNDCLPAIEKITGNNRAYFDYFYNDIRNNSVVIYNKDIVDETRPKEIDEILKEQGVGSMVLAGLNIHNRISGIMGLDNPDVEKLDMASYILKTLSGFVEITVRNRDYINQLDDMGLRDPLTGIMNRRAFDEKMVGISTKDKIAIIYFDLNYLKWTNDHRGHDVGDNLIVSTAKVLIENFGIDRSFRIGGDEFVAIAYIDDVDNLDEKLTNLREDFDSSKVSVAIGGVIKEHKTDEITEVIREAERRMYIDKKYIKMTESEKYGKDDRL